MSFCLTILWRRCRHNGCRNEFVYNKRRCTKAHGSFECLPCKFNFKPQEPRVKNQVIEKDFVTLNRQYFVLVAKWLRQTRSSPFFIVIMFYGGRARVKVFLPVRITHAQSTNKCSLSLLPLSLFILFCHWNELNWFRNKQKSFLTSGKEKSGKGYAFKIPDIKIKR